MNIRFRCAWAAALLLGVFAPPLGENATAGTTILCIGDSITKGQNSYETGGYRMFLDSKLDVTYQFIGKRRDEGQPDLGDWQYHCGYGGYQAASNTVPDRSILKRFKDDSIISKIGRPDVILLHVGANTIGYSDPRMSSESYAGSTSDKADAQLYRLLEYLGNTCPTTKIILAQIIPKASSQRNLADTWKYNFGGTDGKGGIPAVLRKISSSISSRVTLANMFQMNLRDIGRTDLIGDYRVDPDGDGIVDWAKNFKEFNFNSAFSSTGYNSYLLSDGVHPTKLGYELMAASWYRAMRTAGVVHNPTPTAAGAGLLLIFAAVARRRRAA